MNIRRGIIVLLTGLLTSITLYGFIGIKEPIKEMNAANLKVVEVPEQTQSMEHPDFIKAVYESVLPEGENIAMHGKVSANSTSGVYAPRKVIDGNVNGPSYWEAAKDSYPNLLTINLKEAVPVHGIRIRLCPLDLWGKRTQSFSVKTSDDGEYFKELIPLKAYTFDPKEGNEVILIFDTQQTQYVQLEFTSNSGASGAQVAEFEIYSK